MIMTHQELRDIIAIALRRITILAEVKTDEVLDTEKTSQILVTYRNQTLLVEVSEPDYLKE